mgnify:FL=1
MGRKYQFTFEQKMEVVIDNLVNGIGIRTLAKRIGCHMSNIYIWIARYKSFGVDGLKHNSKNLKYPIELKLNAVRDYISGTTGLTGICIKYKIRNNTQLRRWISLYNRGKLMESGGLSSVRIKGIRKNLTFEDRVEVVKHYLEISKDYTETAVKFEVSYQQVYQWVQKYNKFGVDGLIDRRGKRKAEEELTEVEKLKLENKLLKAEKRRIELENAFLKKLNELEGV